MRIAPTTRLLVRLGDALTANCARAMNHATNVTVDETGVMQNQTLRAWTLRRRASRSRLPVALIVCKSSPRELLDENGSRCIGRKPFVQLLAHPAIRCTYEAASSPKTTRPGKS